MTMTPTVGRTTSTNSNANRINRAQSQPLQPQPQPQPQSATVVVRLGSQEETEEDSLIQQQGLPNGETARGGKEEGQEEVKRRASNGEKVSFTVRCGEDRGGGEEAAQVELVRLAYVHRYVCTRTIE